MPEKGQETEPLGARTFLFRLRASFSTRAERGSRRVPIIRPVNSGDAGPLRRSGDGDGLPRAASRNRGRAALSNRLELRMLEKALARAGPCERMLDVPCGAGRLLAALLPRARPRARGRRRAPARCSTRRARRGDAAAVARRRASCTRARSIFRSRTRRSTSTVCWRLIQHFARLGRPAAPPRRARARDPARDRALVLGCGNGARPPAREARPRAVAAAWRSGASELARRNRRLRHAARSLLPAVRSALGRGRGTPSVRIRPLRLRTDGGRRPSLFEELRGSAASASRIP